MTEYLININRYVYSLKFILPLELTDACIFHSHVCMFMQVFVHVRALAYVCGDQRLTLGAISQEILPVLFFVDRISHLSVAYLIV